MKNYLFIRFSSLDFNLKKDDELLEPEQVNYSSSQEEVETEDDCGDAPDAAMLGKDGGTTVYDLTSNDEESCHLLQTEDDSENSGEALIKVILPIPIIVIQFVEVLNNFVYQTRNTEKTHQNLQNLVHHLLL